jgi:hypothetical protein
MQMSLQPLSPQRKMSFGSLFSKVSPSTARQGRCVHSVAGWRHLCKRSIEPSCLWYPCNMSSLLRLRTFIRPYLPQIVVNLTLLLAITALSLYVPRVIRQVVDVGISFFSDLGWVRPP